MKTTPPQRFAVAQLSLMLVLLLWLALTGNLRLDGFLITSFALFILLKEYTAPYSINLPWRNRMRWASIVGYAVFIAYALYLTYTSVDQTVLARLL
ncbi:MULTISPECIES: hypothetical protein [Salinibaculum]|uniref:hypothetical protein n=1 Tax=Salinibaculum TaxID=2732368 RepID=UPI0030CD180D